MALVILPARATGGGEPDPHQMSAACRSAASGLRCLSHAGCGYTQMVDRPPDPGFVGGTVEALSWTPAAVALFDDRRGARAVPLRRAVLGRAVPERRHAPPRSGAPGGGRDRRSDRVAGAHEAVLLAAVAARHPGAHVELYRRHAIAVYEVALRLVAEPPIARAIVDGVFRELWRRPARSRTHGGPVLASLLSLAYHDAAERLAAPPRHHGSPDAGPGPPRTAERESGTPPVQVGGTAQLSGDERDALELAALSGFTYVEVAMLTGQDESTVKQGIRAALLRCRCGAPEEGRGRQRRSGARRQPSRPR